MEFLKIKNLPSEALQDHFFYDNDNDKPFVMNSKWLLENVIKSKCVNFKIDGFTDSAARKDTFEIHSHAIELISAYKQIFIELIKLSITKKTGWFLPFLYFYGDEPKNIVMLNPEWIRHMNSLFFKNPVSGEKEKSTNNSRFFPYKYQDHICHSFVVTIFGKIFLNTIKVPKFTIKKIIDKLSPSYGSEKKIKEFLTEKHINYDNSNVNNSILEFLSKGKLLDLINFIYFVKGSIGFTDTKSDSNWSKYAWEFIGLWHDSGYDNYTFSFLLNDSFRHNLTIMELPEIYFKSIKLIKEKLLDQIENHLSNEYLSDFEEATKDTVNNFASFIKIFEEKSGKNHGRSHALFSGYDLLKRYEELKKISSADLMIYTGMDDKKLNLLVHAIIEHHEKNGKFENEFGIKPTPQGDDDAQDINDIKRYDSDEKQIEGLIQLFIDNPYGHLLRLCDSIAGFARLDIKWPDSSTQNGKEHFKVYFIYDNDKTKVTAKFDNHKEIPLRLEVIEEPANGPGGEYIEEYNYYLFAKLTKKKLKKLL